MVECVAQKHIQHGWMCNATHCITVPSAFTLLRPSLNVWQKHILVEKKAAEMSLLLLRIMAEMSDHELDGNY